MPFVSEPIDTEHVELLRACVRAGVTGLAALMRVSGLPEGARAGRPAGGARRGRGPRRPRSWPGSPPRPPWSACGGPSTGTPSAGPGARATAR